MVVEWTPEKVESFRKAHGLTRKALANLLGVRLMAVYQWERGLRRPSKTAQILLSKIAKEFENQNERR
ncbi:MAG: helix-turn-helix domain-containing protein [Fervidobacterium sp.]